MKNKSPIVHRMKRLSLCAEKNVGPEDKKTAAVAEYTRKKQKIMNGRFGLQMPYVLGLPDGLFSNQKSQFG
jgi:hypothetical protein